MPIWIASEDMETHFRNDHFSFTTLENAASTVVKGIVTLLECAALIGKGITMGALKLKEPLVISGDRSTPSGGVEKPFQKTEEFLFIHRTILIRIGKITSIVTALQWKVRLVDTFFQLKSFTTRTKILLMIGLKTFSL